ncbi:MAG: acyl-CoA dehydrogenase family protein [Chromatocurvus sp.]
MKPTEEQSMLRDSAAKYLADGYSFEDRESQIQAGEPFSRPHWAVFADMGWLAMPFPESLDGLGFGVAETALLCEELGRALVREPYLETVLLAGGMLQRGGATEQVSGIMTGDVQAALAVTELNKQFSLHTVSLSAKRDGQGFTLDGEKTVVRNGAVADIFVVLARTAEADSHSSGVTAFLVHKDDPGLVVQGYRTYDDRCAADLRLEQLQLDVSRVLGEEGCAEMLLAPTLRHAVLGLVAESLGCMQALLDDTLEYTSQRKQFGQPLAKFQALRHRMTDMFMQLELTRSLLQAAVLHVDQDSDRADTYVAAVKAKSIAAGRFIAQSAIQLHGGIATTNDLRVGHYFKRLAVLESALGGRDAHIQRYAQLTGIAKND